MSEYSSPLYTNSLSTSNTKTIAVENARVKMNGYNVSLAQSISLDSSLKNEILQIASSSIPSWGSAFTFQMKEKNINFHDYAIQFVTSAVTGTGTVVGAYLPAYFFIDRMESNSNGINLITETGKELFMRSNVQQDNEDRAGTNVTAGCYDSLAQRTLLSSQTTTNTHIISLTNLLSQLRLNLLNNAHNLDIKVTMANFSDIFVVTSGTLVSSTILSATMICTVTRLNQSTVMNRLNSMAENPYVINGHDVVVTTAVVNSGVSSVTIPLTAFNGDISHFYFNVRLNATAYTGLTLMTFIPITNFSLNDSSGTSISGLVTHSMSTHLNRMYVQSSIYAENYLSSNNQNMNLYFYSHSIDPVTSLKNGLSLGSRKYNSNDTLTINFMTTLSAAVIVDVFGYREIMVEQSVNGIRKI